MVAVLRQLATLLALGVLSLASVAGLDAQRADTPDSRVSAPATHACVQSLVAVAVDVDAPARPHCPSSPMASAAACGGAVALPVESRVQLGGDSEPEPIRAGPRQARDLLLDTPLFRPPIV